MKILFVFGTRPEAIKLAPLIKEVEKNSIKPLICSTGQHDEMLNQVLSIFNLFPDYNLHVMTSNQNLSALTSKLIEKLNKIVVKVKPDIVFVQGDTTSAFCGALVAYYNKIPVAHIEAGLRSYEKYSPFPEEMNRLLISRMTDYHFCPTKKSEFNLLQEGITKNIYNVGNTVIDALYMVLKNINSDKQKELKQKFKYLDFTKKIVLITGHRRESFGIPFKNICTAIKNAALSNRNVQFLYPVHLNPSVQKTVYDILKGINNIFLIKPLDYEELIWILNKSYFVLTDSGGIQEEAPSLGKPVLVMRNVTERTEGIEAGNAILVGTQSDRILDFINKLLNDHNLFEKMAKSKNPYGDGKAAVRIIEIIKREFDIL